VPLILSINTATVVFIQKPQGYLDVKFQIYLVDIFFTYSRTYEIVQKNIKCIKKVQLI
jgi:hypothetical protein